MTRSKGPAEKPLGRFGIACRTEPKFQSVPFRIPRAIQIHPGSLHLHIGLIHAPGIGRGFEMRPASFVQLWGVALDPAIDRGVIDVQSAFPHHLFEVAIAEPHTSDTSARTAE